MLESVPLPESALHRLDVAAAHPFGIRRLAEWPGGVMFTEILGPAALSELLEVLDIDLPGRIEGLSNGTLRAFVMSTVYGALERDVVFFSQTVSVRNPDAMYRAGMGVPSKLDEERILTFLSGLSDY